MTHGRLSISIKKKIILVKYTINKKGHTTGKTQSNSQKSIAQNERNMVFFRLRKSILIQFFHNGQKILSNQFQTDKAFFFSVTQITRFTQRFKKLLFERNHTILLLTVEVNNCFSFCNLRRF